jgi:hypothetical protein
VEEGGAFVKHFHRYLAFNIVWDTDDIEGEMPNLPTEVIVSAVSEDDAEDTICEQLTESTGFCVKSFEYKRQSDLKHYLIHFKQTIDGLETELSRYWRCDAENYTHAIEQLNAEVQQAQGEKVFFHELLKVSV